MLEISIFRSDTAFAKIISVLAKRVLAIKCPTEYITEILHIIII
jgi:hypothetical protein